MKIKQISLSISLLGTIVGCSSSYSIKTNMDKENFTEYFAPSKVNIYERESDINGRFKTLGLVEGEDCQLKAHLAEPDRIIARTQARSKAYKLGANGIVFTGCATIQSQQCIAQIVCYGQMYQIEKITK